jgi:hypothetical protein
MHDYTVLKVARLGSEHALCLSDDSGGYHVARATAAVPAPGARLLGNSPALGFGLLLGTPIDQVYRVIFEAVHCTETEAHDSVHGSFSP